MGEKKKSNSPVYEWLHDPGNNGRLLLKVGRKDFTIGKANGKLWEPHCFGKTEALLVHNTKRTTLQQVNIPKKVTPMSNWYSININTRTYDP